MSEQKHSESKIVPNIEKFAIKRLTILLIQF